MRLIIISIGIIFITVYLIGFKIFQIWCILFLLIWHFRFETKEFYRIQANRVLFVIGNETYDYDTIKEYYKSFYYEKN